MFVLKQSVKAGLKNVKASLFVITVLLVNVICFLISLNVKEKHTTFKVNVLKFQGQRPTENPPSRPKKVLFWTRYYGDQKWLNVEKTFQQCPYKCIAGYDHQRAIDGDALVFFGFRMRDAQEDLPIVRKHSQVWVFYSLEPPTVTNSVGFHGNLYNGFFNWTITYRQDSDITLPYRNVLKHPTIVSNMSDSKKPHHQIDSLDALDPDHKHQPKKVEQKNFAKGKNKLIVAMISNCRNQRMNLVRELQAHIPVDVYGKCGNKGKICTETTGQSTCLSRVLSQYKFYLSFENSQCTDYITEKYFIIPFRHNLVPIVWGASLGSYTKLAVPNSYIHANNFTSVKQLADYVELVNKSDSLYNRYFSWRKKYIVGSGTYKQAWCKFCEALHTGSIPNKVYQNFSSWWDDSCTTEWFLIKNRIFHQECFTSNNATQTPCHATLILTLNF